MSKNKRSLAGFDEVAGETDSNVNNNENVNENVVENTDENVDPIDKVMSTNKNKVKDYVMKGIYFDKDVAAVLDKLKRKGGKGIQSQIINELARKAFQEKGWL